MKNVLLGLFLTGMLMACSNSTPPNTVQSPTPVAVESVIPTATSTPANVPVDETPDNEPDFEGTAGNTEKTNPNATGAALLKDVRSARHANFDRVVFEFEGAQLPSFKIKYIDRPVRACG